QMTLLDEELWVKIQPWELLNQAWMAKNKAEAAPNVLEMYPILLTCPSNFPFRIVRFNTGNRWIQAELVRENNLETRTLVLLFVLRLLRHLVEMNNFNGAL